MAIMLPGNKVARMPENGLKPGLKPNAAYFSHRRDSE